MVGMAYREGQHTGTDPLAATRIPESPAAPGFFTLRDLPADFALALKEQAILVAPAHHEAGGVGVQGPQPQTTGVATIKDVQQLTPPTLAGPFQQFFVLIAAPTGPPAAGRPPAHRHQQGWPLRQARPDQQQAYPMQTWHTDRLARRGVVAGLDMGQALGFAGLHRPQALTFQTFWLLPDATIPQQQALFPLTCPLLHLLARSPPQKTLDHRGRPLGTMQQPTEPFGSPSLTDRIQI